MVALSDSLFVRALTARREDKRILEQQRVDKEIVDEWKRLHQCEEKDGVLYQKEALAVTGGDEIHKDLLQRYHDGTTARHPGV